MGSRYRERKIDPKNEKQYINETENCFTHCTVYHLYFDSVFELVTYIFAF